MSLSIIQAPNEVLRMKCEPVTRFDRALGRLADDMLETIHSTANSDPKGIGLAANQVSHTLRLIVMHVPGWPPMAMCNPVIVSAKGEDSRIEQCLSEPGVKVRITRARKIRVSYQDVNGQPHMLDARELLATCIQHEMDHLEGKLISDYLPNKAEVTAHA